MEKKSELLQQLEEYLKNATPEQIEEDKKEMERWKDVGPTVEEYLSSLGLSMEDFDE